MHDFKKVFQIDKLIPILLIFFLLITNSYYGEYEINPSATSSHYYLNISNSFPQGMSLDNTSQAYIHGERFLISYFVGFVGNLLSIRNFFIFQIFTYFTIFILISVNYKIIDSIVPDKGNKILYFSLFLLNPYILRFSLANPVMINDLIFITSISLLFFSFLNKKNTLFYLALLLAIISRQTSVLIILALSLSLILPYKNEFIDIKKIFFSVLMLIANYLVSQQYLDSANINAFYESQFFGLIQYFQNNFDLLKFFKFLVLPFLSFGPLFIMIIIQFFKKEISFMLNEKNIFFSLLLILFVSQPLLSGPLIAGKNIIRLSTFGYTSLIFLFCLNLKYLKYKSKSFSIIFFILILFWSLHQTYSKIKIFDLLKISPIF
jgi:hypothetical protein